MGRRRSIRFLNPHKPVEPEKIQMMFQAPGALPWREAELEYLQKALDLESNGLL